MWVTRREGRLRCRVRFFITRNTHITWDPAENYCLPLFEWVEQSFVNLWTRFSQISKPLTAWRLEIESEKIKELFSFERRTPFMARRRAKPEYACNVRGVERIQFYFCNNIYSVTSFRTVCVYAITMSVAVTQSVQKTIFENIGRRSSLSARAVTQRCGLRPPVLEQDRSQTKKSVLVLQVRFAL